MRNLAAFYPAVDRAIGARRIMMMLATRIQTNDAIGAMNVNVPPIAKKPLLAKKPTPETTFRRATASAVGAMAPGGQR